MADVAGLAGVSHQTVSRVINDIPGVRPATRERVMAAIAELGYRPNNAARTLATSRSGLIGVIAVGSFLYGPTRTLSGIEEAARSHGFATLLSTIPESDRTAFATAIDTCLNRAVEAIVVIAARNRVVEFLAGLHTDVPIVAVGPAAADLPGLTTLSVDQAAGAEAVIEHLRDRGHGHIALLAGPEHWTDAQARTRAVRGCCASFGIELEVFPGDWSAACGFALGSQLATRAPQQRPTAVFAANDGMALGLLAAFNRARIRVPRQIAVAGFDDVPESGFYSPALTTVHQDFVELGHRTVLAVLDLVDGREPDTAPIAPTLVVRASTVED